MSHAQNIRRAWLSERIGEVESDARLVELGATTFGVTEQTIRKDLNAVYERWAEIDAENQHMHKARFMELGLKILEECRDAGNKSLNFASTVAQFKTLAQIAGVLSDGSRSGGSANAGQASPSQDAIRSRIEKLRSDPKIRERALKLGLDLDDPTLVTPEGESTPQDPDKD